MKRIRNVTKAWIRLGELIRLNADAVKHHRPRSDIQREMVKMRTEIMDWENRHSDKQPGYSRAGVAMPGARIGDVRSAHANT